MTAMLGSVTAGSIAARWCPIFPKTDLCVFGGLAVIDQKHKI